MPDGPETFEWEHIDHKLVSLKLLKIAEDLCEIYAADVDRIRSENVNNQNSATVPAMRLRMQEQRTDEYAELVYKVYCEVWEKQGHQKSAAFIRAVSQYAITPLMNAQRSAALGALATETARTSRADTGFSEALRRGFHRRMDKLAERWRQRLEIEALEREHEDTAKRVRHEALHQRENLRKAIRGRRAAIEHINRTLDNVPSPGSLSQSGAPIRISQRSVGNLIRRRLEHEAALAEMEKEEARLAARGDPANEEAKRNPEQLSNDSPESNQTHVEGKPSNVANDSQQKSLPAAHAHKVAAGVAQVSLADLNVPVGTSLKDTKRALLKLGAPSRRLKDSRILEAADYKIRNPKCGYKEVSVKFFGMPTRADSIRSWVNKRKSSGGKQ